LSRWELPKGTVFWLPICSEYRAPSIGRVPESGIKAAFVFELTDQRPEVLNQLRAKWLDLGLQPGGVVGINNAQITFASGKVPFHSQAKADRQFKRVCRSDQPEARLVHMRYNGPGDEGRVL
jgi:hypothetical protein